MQYIKYTQYTIIEAETRLKLIRLVEEQIKHGWTPLGGLSVDTTRDIPWFYQAMIQYGGETMKYPINVQQNA